MIAKVRRKQRMHVPMAGRALTRQFDTGGHWEKVDTERESKTTPIQRKKKKRTDVPRARRNLTRQFNTCEESKTAIIDRRKKKKMLVVPRARRALTRQFTTGEHCEKVDMERESKTTSIQSGEKEDSRTIAGGEKGRSVTKALPEPSPQLWDGGTRYPREGSYEEYMEAEYGSDWEDYATGEPRDEFFNCF